MSEQVQPPDGNQKKETSILPGESGTDQTPPEGSTQKVPMKYIQVFMDAIKDALTDISNGNAGAIFRRVANAKPPPTTQEENNMNYHILSQKLFEAVSKEDMPCNKPRASTRPGKKKMVKACEGGKEKIVHFGAKGYGHNYSPKARKSFKARHKCGEKKSKLSAQYWACKNLWAGPKGSKASCPSNRQCKK